MKLKLWNRQIRLLKINLIFFVLVAAEHRSPFSEKGKKMGPFDYQQNSTGNQYPETDGFTELKRGEKLPNEYANGFVTDGQEEVELNEN